MCTVCGCGTQPQASPLHGARMVKVERDILDKNNQYAEQNRRTLTQQRIFALNFVSSPGSGKTSLLIRTIEALAAQFPVTVIEGDQQTANDAERIRATGAPTMQINTGKGCHLNAHMVGQAIDKLQPPSDSLLFIENVGNLVCPAAFDLGESHKVAILSITEGEDKPIKYPDMFQAADILLINKMDLLPHLNFDLEQCLDYARKVNPDLIIFQLSAYSEQGMEDWYHWIRAQLRQLTHS